MKSPNNRRRMFLIGIVLSGVGFLVLSQVRAAYAADMDTHSQSERRYYAQEQQYSGYGASDGATRNRLRAIDRWGNASTREIVAGLGAKGMGFLGLWCAWCYARSFFERRDAEATATAAT